MVRIKEWLQRRRDKKAGITPLQSYVRQQEKFRAQYPHYTLGTGTYGMPTIHSDESGSTLRIGSYCSIASGVQIFLGKHHRMDWVSTFPFPAFWEEARHIPDYEISRGDVTIGSDVWLCANCTLLSGITVGHGAVIGMGAVVTQDVAPYSVVAGNPARHIRWRFDEATRHALLATAWWDWDEQELRGIAALLCSSQLDEFLAYAAQRPTRPT